MIWESADDIALPKTKALYKSVAKLLMQKLNFRPRVKKPPIDRKEELEGHLKALRDLALLALRSRNRSGPAPDALPQPARHLRSLVYADSHDATGDIPDLVVIVFVRPTGALPMILDVLDRRRRPCQPGNPTWQTTGTQLLGERVGEGAAVLADEVVALCLPFATHAADQRLHFCRSHGGVAEHDGLTVP